MLWLANLVGSDFHWFPSESTSCNDFEVGRDFSQLLVIFCSAVFTNLGGHIPRKHWRLVLGEPRTFQHLPKPAPLLTQPCAITPNIVCIKASHCISVHRAALWFVVPLQPLSSRFIVAGSGIFLCVYKTCGYAPWRQLLQLVNLDTNGKTGMIAICRCGIFLTFPVFVSLFRQDADMALQIRPQLHIYTSSPVHYALVVLPFDVN